MQYKINIMPIPFFLDLKTYCIGSGEIFTVINRRAGIEVESTPRMLDIGGSIHGGDRPES